MSEQTANPSSQTNRLRTIRITTHEPRLWEEITELSRRLDDAAELEGLRILSIEQRMEAIMRRLDALESAPATAGGGGEVEVIRVTSGGWNVRTATHWLWARGKGWQPRTPMSNTLGMFFALSDALAALAKAPPPPGTAPPQPTPDSDGRAEKVGKRAEMAVRARDEKNARFGFPDDKDVFEYPVIIEAIPRFREWLVAHVNDALAQAQAELAAEREGRVRAEKERDEARRCKPDEYEMIVASERLAASLRIQAEKRLDEARKELDTLKAERDAARAEGAGRSNGCPCCYGDPCTPGCSCATAKNGPGVSSVGCSRCCRYGSDEQRAAAAKRIIGREQRWRDAAREKPESDE